MAGQVGLSPGRLLENEFLALKDLQPHVGTAQLAADDKQVPILCAAAQHDAVLGRVADGGHSEGQARPRAGGVAADEVHSVAGAGQAHAVVELLHRLHTEPVGQAEAHHDLAGGAVHGTDVAEVDHHSLVSQVFEGGVGQVEMDALTEEVGADEGAVSGCRREDRSVISHSELCAVLLLFEAFGQLSDESELP